MIAMSLFPPVLQLTDSDVEAEAGQKVEGCWLSLNECDGTNIKGLVAFLIYVFPLSGSAGCNSAQS